MINIFLPNSKGTGSTPGTIQPVLARLLAVVEVVEGRTEHLSRPLPVWIEGSKCRSSLGRRAVGRRLFPFERALATTLEGRPLEYWPPSQVAPRCGGRWLPRQSDLEESGRHE